MPVMTCYLISGAGSGSGYIAMDGKSLKDGWYPCNDPYSHAYGRSLTGRLFSTSTCCAACLCWTIRAAAAVVSASRGRAGADRTWYSGRDGPLCGGRRCRLQRATRRRPAMILPEPSMEHLLLDVSDVVAPRRRLVGGALAERRHNAKPCFAFTVPCGPLVASPMGEQASSAANDSGVPLPPAAHCRQPLPVYGPTAKASSVNMDCVCGAALRGS